VPSGSSKSVRFVLQRHWYLYLSGPAARVYDRDQGFRVEFLRVEIESKSYTKLKVPLRSISLEEAFVARHV
jgi:hypothetical protein